MTSSGCDGPASLAPRFSVTKDRGALDEEPSALGNRVTRTKGAFCRSRASSTTYLCRPCNASKGCNLVSAFFLAGFLWNLRQCSPGFLQALATLPAFGGVQCVRTRAPQWTGYGHFRRSRLRSWVFAWMYTGMRNTTNTVGKSDTDFDRGYDDSTCRHSVFTYGCVCPCSDAPAHVSGVFYIQAYLL